MHSSRMHTGHSLPYGGISITETPWTETPRTETPPGQRPRSPPLWTDRHLWKHNLRKLRLRAVITKFLLSHKRLIFIFVWNGIFTWLLANRPLKTSDTLGQVLLLKTVVCRTIIITRKRSYGNLMFLHLPVILFTGGRDVMMSLPVMAPIQDSTPPLYGQQAGGTDPTGMLSCSTCVKTV